MAYDSELNQTITTGTAKGWQNGKEFGFIAPEEGGLHVFITFAMIFQSGFQPQDFIQGDELDFSYRTLPDGKRRVTEISAIAGVSPADAQFVFRGQIRSGVSRHKVDHNKCNGRTLLKLVLGTDVRYAVQWEDRVRLLSTMSLTEAREQIGRYIESPKMAPGQKTNIGGTGHVKGLSPAADNSKKGKVKKKSI